MNEKNPDLPASSRDEGYQGIHGDPIDLYIRERNISTDTYGECASGKLLRGFQDWLQERDLDMYSFQVVDVQDYYNEKIETGDWGESSAETFVNYLKGFCNWLHDYALGEAEKNRLRRIRKIRIKTRSKFNTKEYLTSDKYRDLLRLAYQQSPTNDFPRFWLLGWTGMRVGEFVALHEKNLLFEGEQTEGINIPSNALWTPTEKSMSGLIRLLFYDDFTKEIWKQAKFKRGRGWTKGLFKVNVTTQQIRNRMKRYDKEIGIHCHPHQLRKVFNTQMKAVVIKHADEIMDRFHIPADDNLVKIMMGHTTGFKDMTQLYTQYEPAVFKYLLQEKHYMKTWEDEFRDWKQK